MYDNNKIKKLYIKINKKYGKNMEKVYITK